MLTKTICILVLLGLTFDIVESNGFYSAASILAKDDSDPAWVGISFSFGGFGFFSAEFVFNF